MTTVKIQEGTKFETPFNLEDGEGIIFVNPVKNKIMRIIPPGCLKGLLTILTLGIINIFKPNKSWMCNLVITDRRLVTIPTPPNKKNMQVESYYFKDMSGIKETRAQDENDSGGVFFINMKDGGSSTYEKGGDFHIFRPFTGKDALNLLAAAGKGLGDQFEKTNAMMQAHAKTMESKTYAENTGAAHYTEYSPNFAAMDKAAKERASSMDFSNAEQNQLRDLIIDLVSKGIELANN